jgi:cell division protein FtsW
MTDSRKGVRIFWKSALDYDVKLLFPVLFLVGIGVVMIYSASSVIALKKFGTDYYFLKKQAFFSLIGIVVLVICRHVPYRFFRSLTYPFLILALVFLITIQVSGFGFSAGGATRWLRLGRFSFQPSEVTRFVLLIYLAYSLSNKIKTGNIRNFSIGFLPHALVLGVFTILIFLQPDFGSVVILIAIAWILMFIGGVRILHLFGSLAFLLPLVYFFMVHAAYRIKRIMTFMDPWQYPQDEGYQIVHSLMAFGSGGMWGTGLGKGYQKMFYLPEPHTDFIFSVIGEELGLFGVLIILGLYGLILWRGISIAANTKDPFGALVAMGLTTALCLQVFVNMGVSLGLLPTKGLTLPFLSYGGTSLLINMASIGILMNIGAAKSR